jgi:threonine aldolase
VFYDPAPIGLDYGSIDDRAAALNPPLQTRGSRIVLHIQTSEEAVADFLQLIAKMKEEKLESGYVPSATAKSNGITPTNIYVRPVKASEA